jgi:hypothetical protein
MRTSAQDFFYILLFNNSYCIDDLIIFFKTKYIPILIHAHSFLWTHTHHISMSTSEKLDLEIHEVDLQEHFTVDSTLSTTEKIISQKYNTHVKYEI